MSKNSVKISGDIYATINKIQRNLENANGYVNKSLDQNNKESNNDNINIIQSFTHQLQVCLNQANQCLLFEKSYIEDYAKTAKQWDQATQALKSGEKEVAIKKLNKLAKNGKSELVTKMLKESGYKATYKSNAKSVLVIASIKKIKSKKEKQKKDNTSKVATVTVASTVSKASTSTKATKATNAKVVKKTTSKATTVASLKKKLKKALKKGDASAVATYTLLASAIGKKKAKAYVNKLGYSVKYKNNKAVSLNKMKEKNIVDVGKDGNKDKDTNKNNNTTTIDKNENRKPSDTIDGNNTDSNVNNNGNDNTNNNNNNNNTQDSNNNDVVASVDDTNTKPEQPSNPVEDNNQTSTNNTNNDSNNNSNYGARNETSSGNNDSANSDIEVEGNENISDAQQGNAGDDIPADLDDDFDELPKKENKVTTIDTDTEVEKPKKSGGLGVAVPLGLGTIATGAAAVAGVRYLKNRNESEDYDDSEDYDEDSQYIDSAQYAEDEDEYSGPAGSVYTDVSENSVDDLYTDNTNDEIEETYIDPDDFDDDEDDFSNDKAFEEINSNFN